MDRAEKISDQLNAILKLSVETTDKLKENKRMSQRLTETMEILKDIHTPNFHKILAEQEIRQTLKLDVEDENQLRHLSNDQELKGIEYTPSSATLIDNQENSPSQTDSVSYVTALSKPYLNTTTTSQISFQHQNFNENAIFTMQPEISKNVSSYSFSSPFLFGHLKPRFEEISKKTIEVIEKIERGCSNNAVENIENNLETELEKSLSPTSSEVIDIKSFSKMVINEMKFGLNQTKDPLSIVLRLQKILSAKTEDSFELWDLKSCFHEIVEKAEEVIKKSKEKEIFSKMLINEMKNNMKIIEEEILAQESSESDIDIHSLTKSVIVEMRNLLNVSEGKILNENNPGESFHDLAEKASDFLQKLGFFNDYNIESKLELSSKNVPLEEVSEISFVKLPITAMMKKILFGKVPQEELKEIKKQLAESAAQTTESLLIKPSSTKEKISKFESLSATTSRDTIRPIKSQISLKVDSISRLKKIQPEEDLTSVAQQSEHDIEEIPKTIAKSLSVEEREMSALYKKVLLMEDFKEMNDDDGFCDLPKVPSNILSEPASSAWIDKNVSFSVNAHDENNMVNIPLAMPENEEQLIYSGPMSPSTSVESAATPVKINNKISRLRQCKCFMKRISRSFLGKK